MVTLLPTHTMLLTTFLLLYLCIFTAPTFSFPTSGGMAEGSKQGNMVTPNLPLYYKEGKEQVKKKNKVNKVRTRKVLLMMDVADYDETGANPRHEPRKGRPGRNP